ncbi:hypothetical protein [Streptomyces sp. NPDC088246]|uniref:hypothetical protein n=1 Tax=Streptomyces sp. NPDC088246 TaxID=3365842 RepID=UPI0037FFFB3F
MRWESPVPCQGVRTFVVIKELLGHAHIGVTATVYAHVRLRLQRDAIDILSTVLPTTSRPTTTATTHRRAESPSTDVAVNYYRQTPQKPRQDTHLTELHFAVQNDTGRSMSPSGTPTSCHVRETGEIHG